MKPWQWNRHGFRVVPLEVFDLADTTLMLHGDVATVSLLRVIHHLRRLVEDGSWKVHAFEEPILDGARWVGTLRGAGDAFSWQVGDEAGSFRAEDLLRRPIGRVFDPIVKSVRRGGR